MDFQNITKLYKLIFHFILMFKVFTTKEFDEDFNNLDESEKKRVRKIMSQLKEQGGEVGKPLKVSYFREKRFEGKRLYFLFYKEFAVILGLGIGDKKTQQETINQILSDIDYYKIIIKEKLENL